MQKLWLILLIGFALAFIGSSTFTGYSIDNAEPAPEKKPYESNTIDSGEKTVCAAGDLCKVYTIKQDGILKVWENPQEKQGQQKLTGKALTPVGYECYKMSSGSSAWTYVGAGIALLFLGGLVFAIIKITKE